MNRFESLFGITPEEVHTHCVVAPFLPPKLTEYLGLPKLRRGKFYATAQGDGFTFMKSGIGATLTGDAILALQETECEHILFIGAAGLAKPKQNLDIGSLVVPTESINCESFSHTLLHRHENPSTSFADKMDSDKLLGLQNAQLTPVRCMSFGSLFLEDYCTYLFEDLNVDVLEMETSAVFSAAKHINRYASAVLYITDALGNRPYWQDTNKEEDQKIDAAMKHLSFIVQEFSKF